jgi:hypothetical protein
MRMGMEMGGGGTYEGAVGEEFDTMPLAHIRHPIQGSRIYQRKLHHVVTSLTRTHDKWAHLNLVAHDGTLAELRADLVGARCVKVAQAEGGDEAFVLEVAEVGEGGEVVRGRVVLPVELGDG